MTTRPMYLIGGIGAVGAESPGNNGWVEDSGTVRYRVQSGDTVARLATRYLGSGIRMMQIWNLQSPARRAQSGPNAIRTGELLIMPDEAIQKARDLGFLDDAPNGGSSAQDAQAAAADAIIAQASAEADAAFKAARAAALAAAQEATRPPPSTPPQQAPASTPQTAPTTTITQSGSSQRNIIMAVAAIAVVGGAYMFATKK